MKADPNTQTDINSGQYNPSVSISSKLPNFLYKLQLQTIKWKQFLYSLNSKLHSQEKKLCAKPWKGRSQTCQASTSPQAGWHVCLSSHRPIVVAGNPLKGIYGPLSVCPLSASTTSITTAVHLTIFSPTPNLSRWTKPQSHFPQSSEKSMCCAQTNS